MKCLSLIQPWATLLIGGKKRFETRSWQTSHRGPLLIHASKRMPDAARNLCLSEPFKSTLLALGITNPAELPRGMILGTIILDDCLPSNNILEQLERTVDGQVEAAFGDFRPGRYAWRMTEPSHLVVPVVYSGHLGLFEVADSLVFGDAIANTTKTPLLDENAAKSAQFSERVSSKAWQN
jgi:hypothetical protein